MRRRVHFYTMHRLHHVSSEVDAVLKQEGYFIDFVLCAVGHCADFIPKIFQPSADGQVAAEKLGNLGNTDVLARNA